jgi:hypothetical protein
LLELCEVSVGFGSFLSSKLGGNGKA